MRSLLFLLVSCSILLAHGGTYTGPAGGGTPTYNGPIGGGTIGPQPGGYTPPSHGGTTPAPHPGGATPPSSAPTGRGFGRPSPVQGGGRFGGATSGRKKSHDNTGDWTWWWDLNDDSFYNVRKSALETFETENKDTFLGGGGDLHGSNSVALRHISRSILPELLKGLSDPFYDARAAAAIALGKTSSDKEAVSKLSSMLSDSDYRVREAACIGLGLFGDVGGIAPLKGIIDEKGANARLRFFASLAIGQIVSNNPTTEDEEIEYLKNIVEAKNANVDSNLGAVIALSLIKNKTVSYLEGLLSNEEADQMIRAYAALGLGRQKSKSSTKLLQSFVNDNNRAISTSCVIALGNTTDRGDVHSVGLLSRVATNHPDRATRNFAIISLGKIGGGRAEVTLFDRFNNGSYDDLTFSAIALGISGRGESEGHADTLISKYQSTKDDNTKAAIAIGLGILGNKKAIHALSKDISDGSESLHLKGYVALSLGMLNAKDESQHIHELLATKGDTDVCKRAAIALSLMRDPEVLSKIEQLIKVSANNKSTLAAYTIALGYIGTSKSLELLTSMTSGTEDNQRAFAYVALGLLGSKNFSNGLASIQENANYMAQTQAVAELLTIL